MAKGGASLELEIGNRVFFCLLLGRLVQRGGNIWGYLGRLAVVVVLVVPAVHIVPVVLVVLAVLAVLVVTVVLVVLVAVPGRRIFSFFCLASSLPRFGRPPSPPLARRGRVRQGRLAGRVRSTW